MIFPVAFVRVTAPVPTVRIPSSPMAKTLAPAVTSQALRYAPPARADSVNCSSRRSPVVSEVDERTLTPPAAPTPVVVAALLVTDRLEATSSASVIDKDPYEITASPAVIVNLSAPPAPVMVTAPVPEKAKLGLVAPPKVIDSPDVSITR